MPNTQYRDMVERTMATRLKRDSNRPGDSEASRSRANQEVRLNRNFTEISFIEI